MVEADEQHPKMHHSNARLNTKLLILMLLLALIVTSLDKSSVFRSLTSLILLKQCSKRSSRYNTGTLVQIAKDKLSWLLSPISQSIKAMQQRDLLHISVSLNSIGIYHFIGKSEYTLPRAFPLPAPP